MTSELTDIATCLMIAILSVVLIRGIISELIYRYHAPDSYGRHIRRHSSVAADMTDTAEILTLLGETSEMKRII